MHRRSILRAIALLPWTTQFGFAQDVVEDEDLDLIEVPKVLQRADFGLAWQRIDDGIVVSDFVSPKIPAKYLNELCTTPIGSADEIDAIITQKTGINFIAWFNSTVSGTKYWETKNISHADAPANFKKFWDLFPTHRGSLSLLDFLTYMSVFINEVDGNLTFRSEKINSVKHKTQPGITYLFDRLIVDSPEFGKWSKKSYNEAPNRTCFQLFNDASFRRQFSELKYAAQLSGTQDRVWDGKLYPRATYPVSTSPEETGIILECDFYKFRGRGLIQTTWRANYHPLAEYIQHYNGVSPTIRDLKKRWDGISADRALTISSNVEWDTAFKDPACEVLTYGVWRHREDNGYWLSTDPDTINGTKAGSLLFFGNNLGGAGYGHRLRARVFTMANLLLR
ncbi:hypothetical protein GR198_29310 [Rhizobium leguminosarum]|uniref:hypothetical protein n=1 Tax=Rhizobium leguminosarum TaxID=384 RepID=UPI0013C0B452|nr:hypothetical protein [Rhizobium leguminosarum]NEH59824.1 hypothetical protein [Rhizobium leguminosarum]